MGVEVFLSAAVPTNGTEIMYDDLDSLREFLVEVVSHALFDDENPAPELETFAEPLVAQLQELVTKWKTSNKDEDLWLESEDSEGNWVDPEDDE